MQKFIAKYGLAAHLAILAVAPLFLYPFVGETVIAQVLLWLTLPAALWMILEPSVRSGEYLRDARHRVVRSIRRDPLFWVMLALTVFCAVRAVNTGIALAYDAEKTVWYMASPVFPILPGSVENAGFLPFAVSLGSLVLIQGCRHSLGRSARMAFLLILTTFSGLAAVITHVAILYDHPASMALLEPANASCSFIGFSYWLLLLCGTVAAVAAFESKWRLAMLLLPLAIGGNAAGGFSFSPSYLSVGMAGAELVMLAYAFVYSARVLPSSGEFKQLIAVGISLVLGGLMVAVVIPEKMMSARIDEYRSLVFFTDKFWELRSSFSAIAFKTWISNLWIGTGLGSFVYDFKFNAQAADWALSPAGATAMTNGWWQMLAERGIVGIVLFLLPLGFLLFAYGYRVGYGCYKLKHFPHPSCVIALLAVSLWVAAGFFDCSLTRAEVLLFGGAVIVVSARSYPKMKKEDHVKV